MSGLAPPTTLAPRRGRPPMSVRPLAPVEAAPENIDDLLGEPEPPAASRPEMRTQMREEDPRARAARRALEIREHQGDTDPDDYTDEFYIDPRAIPDGWVYQWKMETLLNEEQPSHKRQIAMGGWDAVPAYRHPEMMPIGESHKTIDRKGMRLYERPKEIDDLARDKELRKARNQVRQKEEALNGAPDGHFERHNKDAPLAKINKGYEPIEIPEN